MSQELVANTTLSHYRIVSKIGAGGMGEVYLAEDTRLRRKIALKVLPESLAQDTDRLSRFEQEAYAASALNHPNILTIYEFGTEGETHFLAGEFIEGETLRARLQRAPLSINEALDIAVQIAQALAAAHVAGIIHRDIKPENVMLRRDGIVKVLDFGLAKLVELAPLDAEAETRKLGLTQAGTIMGTVAYVSPEQARGLTVDGRSDLFSLGVVLYEMLTRRQPFTGETISHTIVAILEQEPPPLAQEIPAELARILKQTLAKKAEDRHVTAQALLTDLKKLQKRIEVDAAHQRDSSADESIDVQTMMLNQVSGAAPEALATASGTAPQTVSDKPKTRMWWLIALSGLLVLVAGFLTYRSFSASSRQIDSLAVLPFQNRSANADSEYLSDGLAESLIYRLSQLPNLKVTPTSSVFRYKGKETDPLTIGNELGVRAVMSGRMVQRGENLTLSVELVDVVNNTLLWGEQYERRMSELLATQREIVAEITNKLQLKLSGESEQKLAKRYTTSNEAYQLYLKGRFFWNKRNEENLRKASEQFKAAADEDPNYALAYVGLADCYVLLPVYSSAPANEVLPQARAYALRALEIDDSLGEAHTALGYVDRYSWNWAEAEKELKLGIELNPNYATAHKFYGNLITDLGRTDEGLLEYKRAQELEPLSLIISINIAEACLEKGDLNGAAAQCQRAIDLDPNWYYAHLQLSLVYLTQGLNADALAEAEKSVELSKQQSVPLGVLGYVYAQTGKRSGATAILEELKERYAKRQANGFDLARVYVGLSEKDQAFAWLEKDFQSHNATLPSYLCIAPLDSLRDDPRFKDLVRRIGLPVLK